MTISYFARIIVIFYLGCIYFYNTPKVPVANANDIFSGNDGREIGLSETY